MKITTTQVLIFLAVLVVLFLIYKMFSSSQDPDEKKREDENLLESQGDDIEDQNKVNEESFPLKVGSKNLEVTKAKAALKKLLDTAGSYDKISKDLLYASSGLQGSIENGLSSFDNDFADALRAFTGKNSLTSDEYKSLVNSPDLYIPTVKSLIDKEYVKVKYEDGVKDKIAFFDALAVKGSTTVNPVLANLFPVGALATLASGVPAVGGSIPYALKKMELVNGEYLFVYTNEWAMPPLQTKKITGGKRDYDALAKFYNYPV